SGLRNCNNMEFKVFCLPWQVFFLQGDEKKAEACYNARKPGAGKLERLKTWFDRRMMQGLRDRRPS
ncbi:MAG TPA: hypothetical protein PLT21_05330, partial [Syntrophales bacterium]|nr:hypothetical protein [Syntrophales bacterium]